MNSYNINWNNEKDCLAAVKRNGYPLQHVKEQTPEICLAAIKQDPEALQYVNLEESENETK